MLRTTLSKKKNYAEEYFQQIGSVPRSWTRRTSPDYDRLCRVDVTITSRTNGKFQYERGTILRKREFPICR